jgi:hypothetical protein
MRTRIMSKWKGAGNVARRFTVTPPSRADYAYDLFKDGGIGKRCFTSRGQFIVQRMFHRRPVSMKGGRSGFYTPADRA